MFFFFAYSTGRLYGILFGMDVKYENGAADLTVDCFEPRHIFDNGQSFRFFPCGADAYEGVAFGRYLRVEKTPGGALLYPCGGQDFETVWRRYFDLDRDYSSLFSSCADAALERGREYGCGLRLLRQEPFEMLISFIISANNNVKRIRGIVARVCELCGQPFMFEDRVFYTFPAPEALAGVSDEALADCGCGYRAPYVRKSAQAVADGFSLEGVSALPYGEAKRALQTLPGVGPKVADCVLLFSLGFYDAFPADVWIKRALREHYGYAGSEAQIHDFARRQFGRYAGIAQQYLFFRQKETKN